MEMIDYYFYASGIGKISPRMAKPNLPHNIRDQLLQGEKFTHKIAVSYDNRIGQDLLDSYFHIPTSNDWRKVRRIEVSRSELNNYTHFFVLPRTYNRTNPEVKGDILFQETEPLCQHSCCSLSGTSAPPYYISPKASKSLGVGAVHGLWTRGHWVIAPHVKTLFEDAGITGLGEFYPCLLEGHGLKGDPHAYVSRVSEGVLARARTVVPKSLCESHRFYHGYMFDRYFTREDLGDADIQKYVGAHSESDGQDYYLMQPGFIVTRKVLELIFKYKVRGLTSMTMHLNENFLPVPIVDESS